MAYGFDEDDVPVKRTALAEPPSDDVGGEHEFPGKQIGCDRQHPLAFRPK